MASLQQQQDADATVPPSGGGGSNRVVAFNVEGLGMPTSLTSNNNSKRFDQDDPKDKVSPNYFFLRPTFMHRDF